ncbi:hypothetical protein F5880DRAFT_1617885 [Lentinula raphanica]|nr:hypothetical protein F5880DRAFT_1617885 [Lentinula raphanica]
MSTTQNDQNAQGANEDPMDILKLLGPPTLSPDLTHFFAPDTRSSVKQEQAEDHEHAFVENRAYLHRVSSDHSLVASRAFWLTRLQRSGSSINILMVHVLYIIHVNMPILHAGVQWPNFNNWTSDPDRKPYPDE